jgi:2,4-dienoyl-CoA reductase (NADPH2)
MVTYQFARSHTQPLLVIQTPRDIIMTLYPHLLAPLRAGLHDPAQPGADGLDARRPGGGQGRFCPHGGVLRRTRAGGVGLIVTGGIAPNDRGRPMPGGARLTTEAEAEKHRPVTAAVHQAGGKIAHADPAFRPLCLPRRPGRTERAAGADQPDEAQGAECRRGRADRRRLRALRRFGARCRLRRRRDHGLGGLPDQRIHRRAHQPAHDAWGGAYENRIRFPVEIVRRTRERVGRNFIIIYRLSMLDLVEGGSTLDEVVQLAQAVEAAGATIINTGIGWHEARIPTIATKVPRAAFAWVTRQLMGKVGIPLVATNRINTPEVAEQLLADGYCDMVSMARPFLADPLFVRKAEQGRADEINTCIGCNQACLDHTFAGKVTSCLVNPRACHETLRNIVPAKSKGRIAVVGAGPAGLSFATTAAQGGFDVTLFDAAGEIGGQFNIAKQMPGKEEFYETLRFYRRQIET